MEAVGKKRSLNEELTGGRDAEDQQPAIERPAFEPQSSCFNEINRGDVIALPEKRFISGERPPFKRLFVET